MEEIFISNCEEDTETIGGKIAERLHPGATLALCGALGAGKTALVRSIAKKLGIENSITSPSYPIINKYELKKYNSFFYHVDVYRLNCAEDFLEIGGNEIFYDNSISAIEWADKIKEVLPNNTIYIEIEIIEGGERRIKLLRQC